jgi:seryl-tRNA synthetase
MSARGEERKVPENTVERLLALAEEKKAQDELTKEEMAEFKKATNSIMSSKNGRFFWKMSKKMMKIDKMDHDFTPVNMAVAKAYRNYYLMINNMLSADVRAEIDRE